LGKKQERLKKREEKRGDRGGRARSIAWRAEKRVPWKNWQGRIRNKKGRGEKKAKGDVCLKKENFKFNE